MNKTKIEWVKNPDGSPGYTWNPITGCLNHTNGLCNGGGFPCYAYRLANGRLKERYLNDRNGVIANFGNMSCEDAISAEKDPFYPRFWQGKLAKMVWQQGTKPKGIFVCDMGELFGDWIPKDWQHQIFSAIKCNPQHRFYLLTKQPQNLIKFSPFPQNCWVGVTVTDRYLAHNASHYLPNIEAKVKFISFEPLLDNVMQSMYCWNLINACQWFIIGAQTKPYRPPRIEWVREIVEAADKAGVPVFLKDNLKPLLIDAAGYPHASCELLNRVIETVTWELRQEMPDGHKSNKSH